MCKHPNRKDFTNYAGWLDAEAFDEAVEEWETAQEDRWLAERDDVGDQIHELRRDEPDGGCDDENCI